MARFDKYDRYIGLLINDESVKTANLCDNDAGAGNSTYSQAGRRPGVPAYDQAAVASVSTTAGDLGPNMVLEATGDQADVSYHIKSLKGGMPGDQAEVVWRPSTDDASGELWRGYNTHNVLEWHTTSQQYDRADAPVNGAVNFDSCPTADGQVLFVSVSDSSNEGTLKCARFDPQTHTASSYVVIADSASTPTADDSIYPLSQSDPPICASLLLPSGRLLVYVLTKELYTVSGGNMTLWVYYSDDHGATWRSANYLALNRVIDGAGTTPLKLRAAYSNGSVLLLLYKNWFDGTTKYGHEQYASDDGGLNFKLVEDWETDTSTLGQHGSLVVDTASGIITMVYYDLTGGGGAAARIRYRRVANPFVPLSSVNSEIINSDAPTHIECYGDSDGTLYTTWGPIDDQVKMAYSRDGGASWTIATTSPFDSGIKDCYDHWSVSACAGRAIWIMGDSGADAAGGLTEGLMLYCETGGWNTLSHPRYPGIDPTENWGWGGTTGETWLPFRLPSDLNWTSAGAGTITLTDSGGHGQGVNFNTSASAAYMELTGTDDPQDGFMCEWSIKLTSGSGGLSQTRVGLSVTIGDGFSNLSVDVRFTGTQVKIYDNNASADVATASVNCASSPKVFKLALHSWPAVNGFVTLYVRDPDSDEWTALITSSSIVVGTGPGVATTIRWGHIAALGANTSRWHFFHHQFNSGNGVAGFGYYDDLANNTLSEAPFTLYGKRLPALPHRAYLDQGLYVHGSGGPALRGDTWSVSPSYDYPIENVDLYLSPSPNRKWRSSDLAKQRIAWEVAGGLNSGFGSTSYGVALFGCNFNACSFRGWDGAAWTTLASVDFSWSVSGLKYTTSGNVIQVDTGSSSTDSRWIAYNELAGCTFDFGGGVHRKIRSNTEGVWTSSSTKRPTLIFEDPTGTEPGSGTGSIWLTDGFALVHENSTKYTRFCVEIPSGTTADGYFEVGTIVVGALVAFGTKYSRNRAISTEATVELSTGRGGQRTAQVLGSPLVVIEASWVEGYDSSPTSGLAPVPDYLSMRAGSTNAIAARGDHLLLEGVQRRVNGPATPIVYLPNLPELPGGTDTQTRAGREYLWLGRMVGTVSRETVLGDEGVDEAVRLTGFKMEVER